MENSTTTNSAILPNTVCEESTRPQKTIKSEIMGLIQNEIYVLGEDLCVAEVEYSKKHRQDPFSCEFVKQAQKCDILEAKIDILEKLKKDLEDMFTPPMLAN